MYDITVDVNKDDLENLRAQIKSTVKNMKGVTDVEEVDEALNNEDEE